METTTVLEEQILNHMNRAITYAYSISNGQSRHEDFYQEAITRVLTSNQHNPEPKVDAGYLNKAVRNVAIDTWKADKRMDHNIDVTSDSLNHSSYRIEQDYENKDILSRIQEQVSEDAWRVINLISEGYSVPEICQMMELSNRKVRYHIERVRVIGRRI